MGPRKQINNIFSKIILSNILDGESADEIIKDYEKLNKKCDEVISKIKNRKELQRLKEAIWLTPAQINLIKKISRYF